MEAARLERTRARSWSLPTLPWSPQVVVFVLLLILLANLVLVPLVMVVLTALNVGPVATNPGLSLDYFRQAWSSPITWAILGNTLIFAVGSTILSLGIG